MTSSRMGSSFARAGQMLPPYDTRETLRALAGVLARYAPRTVIALGDSFHDRGGPDRLGADDRRTLAGLQAGRRWLWITGNHDRTLPDDIGGEVLDDLALGRLTLRHEPLGGALDEIAGHLHPAGKVRLRGRSVRRRCFVTDGRRCVMPAFGTNPNVMCYLDDIFVYLRARANDAVPRGRPQKREDKPEAVAKSESSCLGQRS